MLQNFHRETGHCRVPAEHVFEGNVCLDRWLVEQRYQYGRFMEGKKSKIMQDKIDKLDALDFDWGKTTAERWKAQFQLLVDFQKKHGHCRVPSSHAQLGNWAERQRYEFRKLQDSKPTRITQERIDQLNSVGFVWNLR